MGTERARVSQALFKDIPIIEQPYYLSPEEDDERLKRIAGKIVAIIRGIQTRERGKRGRPAELAGISYAQETAAEVAELGLGEWKPPRSA